VNKTKNTPLSNRRKSTTFVSPPHMLDNYSMISTLETPGWKWVGFLGGIGFAVGFFGPMIFEPEANQGPMVGIFITGPGGALLGLILILLMKFLPVSAGAQWRLLVGICLVGTVSTLLIVQPEPARLGFIVEIEVTGVRTPAQATDQVVREWKESFVSVTWATPRAGSRDAALARGKRGSGGGRAFGASAVDHGTSQALESRPNFRQRLGKSARSPFLLCELRSTGGRALGSKDTALCCQ